MTKCLYYMKNENMSLRQYCILHGYCYQTIKNYIVNLGLTYQEAIERHKIYAGCYNTKTIYWYKGESLMQYCRKHKYNYPTIRGKIVNEGYTVEEAIAFGENLKQKRLIKLDKKKGENHE